MDASNEHESSGRSAIADFTISVILRPTSMIVLDVIVIAVVVAAMVFRVDSLIHELFHGKLLIGRDIQLDIFAGIADILVCYGVALESRSHLLRSRFAAFTGLEPGQTGIASEHTGTVLVVWGLVIELGAQICHVALDMAVPPLIVAPLSIFAVTAVVVSLMQLIKHLRAVCANWKIDREWALRLSPGPTRPHKIKELPV